MVWTLVAGAVLTIVFLAIMIPIGLGVSNTVLNAYPRTDWSSAMNQTATNLQNQMASSFTLFTILPLIVAAGTIITVLFLVFRRGAGVGD